MESGRLLFDWEQTSEAIALISLGGKGEGSFSLLHSLVSEASASYPQLSQLRLIHIPLPVSRLESWSYWLAAQVVGQWRDFPVENYSVATVVNELGLSSAESKAPFLAALDKTVTDNASSLNGDATTLSTGEPGSGEWLGNPSGSQSPTGASPEGGFPSVGDWRQGNPPAALSHPRMRLAPPLTSQLAERVQLLQERQRQQKLTPSRLQQWLDQEAAGMAAWFTQSPLAPSESSQPPMEASGCLAQLQSNVLALRLKTQRQLKDCFVRLLPVGTWALLTWLGSLGETLDGLRADYEAQRQDHLQRESSAWRAYYNLRAQLERNWGWSGQGRLDWEAALRALATAYDFKLGAEIYTQATQLVGELAQQTRLYAASVAPVDAMLASWQGWLTERGSVEPLFVPLLKDFLAQRVNPAQLLSELENWVGCPLDQWEALESAESAALCEQILAQTRPLCLEMYAECCHWILNLDPSDRQTQPTKTTQPPPASALLATMSPNPEKRLSLQVRNADIRDVLALLSQVSGEKLVADDSISGTVSLTLNDFSLTETLNALVVAGNLTYTKSGDAYTFSQRPSADAPVTAMQLGELA